MKAGCFGPHFERQTGPVEAQKQVAERLAAPSRKERRRGRQERGHSCPQSKNDRGAAAKLSLRNSLALAFEHHAALDHSSLHGC